MFKYANVNAILGAKKWEIFSFLRPNLKLFASPKLLVFPKF